MPTGISDAPGPRELAIHNGDLVEVDPYISHDELGIRPVVAVTAAAWEKCIAWTGTDTDRTRLHLDEDDRLFNVLAMAAARLRTVSWAPGDPDLYGFHVGIVPRDCDPVGADDDAPVGDVHLYARFEVAEFEGGQDTVLTVSLASETLS